ncbi:MULTISPECIES: hypothetical protein [Methylobacteriaceae]
MNKPRQPMFHAVPDAERLAKAKQYTDRVVGHLMALFPTHEANQLVIYGDTLSRQIPPSYAAHAFNQFQQNMHLMELLRLCALWDKPGADRESIPTILALIDKPEIVHTLADATHRFYANELTATHLTPFKDADHQAAYEAWWEDERKTRADEEAAKLRTWLDEARASGETAQASPELTALREFRDGYIAHNLSLPEPDPNAPTKVQGLRYGDETKLLETSIEITDRLHLALNGTSFDWNGSREIAASNAEELWGACQFIGITRNRRKSLRT